MQRVTHVHELQLKKTLIKDHDQKNKHKVTTNPKKTREKETKGKVEDDTANSLAVEKTCA